MKNKKLIKKIVYNGINPRERQYHQMDKTGQIVADVYRAVYQDMKKQCKGMTKTQIKEHLKRSKA